MCELCRKVDFGIETLEALFPAKEIKEVWASSFADDAETQKYTQEADDTSVYANFAVILCIRFCIKHRVHPVGLFRLFQYFHAEEYGRETARKIFMDTFGVDPFVENPHASQAQLKKILEDYDS
jgi:hypothetical protein